MAKMNFNDFAERYCGTANKEEQIPILLDCLLTMNCQNEISEEELSHLFGTECQIEQTYFEPNDYYDTVINGDFYCMSLIKII